MSIKRSVIFVCANEQNNAGERDYMLALADEINRRGLVDGTRYFGFRIMPEEDIPTLTASRAVLAWRDDTFKREGTRLAPTLNDLASSGKLPATKEDFERLPSMDKLFGTGYDSKKLLKEIADSDTVEVVAVGHSTLEAAHYLDTSFLRVDLESDAVSHLSYITHLVDEVSVPLLSSTYAAVYAPITQEELESVSELDSVENVTLLPLEAVPHPHKEDTMPAYHIEKYAQTEQGQKVLEMVDSGDNFAFAVLNAGFKKIPESEHRPYTEEEAKEHGYALGYMMPKGTHLVLAHGGPRNLADEETGANTIDAFTEAYHSVQGDDITVFQERFEFGLSYDARKVGLVLAQEDNCEAYISNAEGYSTMDDAIQYVDNQKTKLAMFPFKLLYDSDQREKNIDKYHKLGMEVLIPIPGTLQDKVEDATKQHIESLPQKPKYYVVSYKALTKTPVKTEDAAKQIVDDLHLAASVAPAPKPASATEPKVS